MKRIAISITILFTVFAVTAAVHAEDPFVAMDRAFKKRAQQMSNSFNRRAQEMEQKWEEKVKEMEIQWKNREEVMRKSWDSKKEDEMHEECKDMETELLKFHNIPHSNSYFEEYIRISEKEAATELLNLNGKAIMRITYANPREFNRTNLETVEREIKLKLVQLFSKEGKGLISGVKRLDCGENLEFYTIDLNSVMLDGKPVI
ncbi:MAG: hypothetical protein V1770_05460 [bacterium]